MVREHEARWEATFAVPTPHQPTHTATSSHPPPPHLTNGHPHPLVQAPEVIQQSYNEACDAWSAGIMMYQLLTGRFPFWDNVKDCTLQQVCVWNGGEGGGGGACRMLHRTTPAVFPGHPHDRHSQLQACMARTPARPTAKLDYPPIPPTPTFCPRCGRPS